MTHEEGMQYWRPAAKKVLPLVSHPEKPEWHNNPVYFWKGSKLAESIALANLLGLPYPKSEWFEQIELTSELKTTLTALVGPYSHIIVKMLEARKREETSV